MAQYFSLLCREGKWESSYIMTRGKWAINLYLSKNNKEVQNKLYTVY